MGNNRWGQYFQVATNLAVLLGVVLVVIQLRQNSELLELQIIKQVADTYTAAALETLPENFNDVFYKSIDSPEDLTGAELLALDRYLWGRLLTRWRGLYDLADLGLLEDSAWRRSIVEDAGLLDYPYGRAWWNGIKNWETTLPEELVALVDEVLENSPGDSQRDVFAKTKRQIILEQEKSGQ